MAKRVEHTRISDLKAEMQTLPDFRDKVDAPGWRELLTLAVELERSTSLTLGIVFMLVMFFFIWRSFHAMRIGGEPVAAAPPQRPQVAVSRD